MFPKKQEPTNREAFTKVIGQQAHAHLPTWPICKQLNADAPKPPTYLFINSIFKERGHKTNNTPELRAYLPSCIQIPLQAFHPASRQPRLHHCVASSSVRRYLGKPDSARKRKKDRTVNFLRKAERSTKSSGFKQIRHKSVPVLAESERIRRAISDARLLRSGILQGLTPTTLGSEQESGQAVRILRAKDLPLDPNLYTCGDGDGLRVCPSWHWLPCPAGAGG